MESLKKIFKIFDPIVNYLFIIFTMIYYFSILISRTVIYSMPFWYNIFHIIIRLSLMLFVAVAFYKIISFKFSFKTSIILLIILGYFVFLYLFNGGGPLLAIYCYFICFIDIDVEKYVKIMFFTLLFSISFIYVLRFFNVIPDTLLDVSLHYEEGYRKSLGFYVPNCSTYYFVILELLYIYIKKEKTNYLDLFIILLANVVLYLFTETRNGLIICFMCILLVLFVKCNKNVLLDKIFDFVSSFSFILGSISIFVMTLLYALKIPFFNKLNDMLSGRLMLNLNALNKLGIKLLGQPINYDTVNTYEVVDSSYVDLFLRYGYINSSILLMFFCFIGILAYRSKNRWLQLCVIVMAYFCIFDTPLTNISINPFSMFFFSALFLAYPSLKKAILYHK